MGDTLRRRGRRGARGRGWDRHGRHTTDGVYALGAAVAVIALAWVLWMPASGRAAFPGANGLIAFDTRQIVVMNPDGTNRTQLTHSTKASTNPSFSPDGKKLAFVRRRELGGGTDIFTIGVDGSNETRLTDDVADDDDPSWSADGSKVVFHSFSTTTFSFHVWTVNADGSGLTQLTSGSSDNSFATFSPDGAKIAFTSTRDAYLGEIYLMDPDGSDVTCVTTNATAEGSPSFSPDGSKLAFQSYPRRRDGDPCHRRRRIGRTLPDRPVRRERAPGVLARRHEDRVPALRARRPAGHLRHECVGRLERDEPHERGARRL
jgi:dipeptidyl aminopeptidase/acylaminoacyl peptidase